MRFYCLLLVCLFSLACTSQPKFNYYSANKNPEIQLLEASKKASDKNRLILAQVGGDWCPWTYRLDLLKNNNEEIKELIKDHYIFVPINHSEDNPNIDFIHRFDKSVTSIPHWFILNAQGELINSVSLGQFETFNSFQPADLINVLKEPLKE